MPTVGLYPYLRDDMALPKSCEAYRTTIGLPLGNSGLYCLWMGKLLH